VTLLAPAWLLLSAVAGLVFLLHARKRSVRSVASTMLWRLLNGTRRQKRHLRRPPLTTSLILQLLVIALVALAVAEPILGSDKSEDHTIFLIDVSGSMRTTDVDPSRFDAAHDYVRESIRAIGENGGVVSVVAVGAAPAILVARLGAAEALAIVEARLSATDAKADWREAAGWVASIRNHSETTRLIIATDAPVEARTAVATIDGIDIDAVAFHGTATRNTGLSAVIESTSVEDGEWRITGDVVFAGVAPEAIEIELNYRRLGTDGFLSWDSVTIDPADEAPSPTAGLRIVLFTVTTRFPGAGDVLLRLPSDAGPSDNELHFALEDEPPRLSVLLVGRHDEHLVRAFSAMEFVELAAAASLPRSEAAFDLVVVNDVEVDRPPSVSTLWLGRSAVSGTDRPEPIGAEAVTLWRSEHPLSEGIDWASLTSVEAFAASPLDAAVVLLAAGDVPLIQARTTTAGREIRVGVDVAGWADESSFPLFLANLLDWLNIRHGQSAVHDCTVGVPCALAPDRLDARIEGPDGDIIWSGVGLWPTTIPDGVDRSFVPQRAGFYTLIDGDERLTLAANPPPLTETGQGAGLSTRSSPLAPTRSLPLQVWLIAAIVLLLVAEGWVAGRGADRFLRRDALVSSAPFFRRRRAVLGLRTIAILAGMAALFALPWPKLAPSESVVVAASASSDDESPPADVADGVVWVVPDAHPSLLEPTERPIRSGAAVGYEAAIELAAATIPPGGVGRIVLADGAIETVGAVGAAVPMLADRGLPLDVIASDRLLGGDVLVSEVSSSLNARTGDRLIVSALVFAESETTATIAVLVGGAVMARQETRLDRGFNPVEMVLPAPLPGSQLIELVVEAPGDPVPGNNRNGVWVNAGPAPSVLVLAPDQAAGDAFAEMLAVQGLTAEVSAPEDAPRFLDGWLERDVIVLMNVPAVSLTTRQQGDLRRAVEVHGRGLVILGGENSFGPGGYYETALEELSPLSSRVPHETPRAALVFVLDRSGSMQAIVDDGIDRLTIAKEATVGALDLLNQESEVAVVAFDSEARVVFPIRTLGAGRTALQDALGPLEPGGGTALFPALEAALGELEQSEAATKHIVVLTDGLVEPIDFSSLIDAAVGQGITISTIAIGQVPRTDRLELIAAGGGGAFHSTGDVRALPAIMSQEALMLMSSPFKQETSAVAFVGRETAAFLAGLPAMLPPVDSFVETTAKPAADLHLALTNADGEEVPLLATWRYGNGEVVAFAAHGIGAGTARWNELPRYPLLWGQAIRDALPVTRGPGLHVTIQRRGDEAILVADVIDENGEPVSGARVVALPSDDFGAAALMRETAVGRYRATFPLPVGLSLFEVVAERGHAEVGIHASYPARDDYGRAPIDVAALTTATGGEVVTDLATVLNVGTAWSLLPERRWWLLAALVLFLADLAIRDPSAFAWNGGRAVVPATANR